MICDLIATKLMAFGALGEIGAGAGRGRRSVTVNVTAPHPISRRVEEIAKVTARKPANVRRINNNGF